MMRSIKVVLVPILLLWTGSLAAAQPFTALFIFGDSTVDTGWYINSKSGESSYDNYMQPTPTANFGVGRPTSSPGDMSVEVLATALGLSAIPANQNGGTNYATGGAKNARHNATSGDGFPNAVPTVMQLKTYLTNNTASATALYVISSGDNDVSFALKHHIRKTYLTKAANALANEINTLWQAGAKYILVVGLPESFGSTTRKKRLRGFYNKQIRSKLASLGVPYLWGAADAVRKLIESYNTNPPTSSPFGITNYTLGSTTCAGTCSACPVPTPDPNVQPPITTDWAYVCSASAGAPSVPTNGVASEWADDNHYATGGQSVFGAYFYCAAAKKWSTLAWSSSPTLPDSFTCDLFSSVLQPIKNK